MRQPLHAICPYFAMFPESFAHQQIVAHSAPGDWVFDPFCGRGTTILEALLSGRQAVGSDINPVAVCVSRAKAVRPTIESTQDRLSKLKLAFGSVDRDALECERNQLPGFFRRAFHHETLRELLFLRSQLAWRTCRTDGFLAALAVGSLHGEMDKSSAYFSNQMPRTICLKPEYSLRYWRTNNLFPRRKHVFTMLHEKSQLRLGSMPDDCGEGSVISSDARQVGASLPSLGGQVRLVLTSPPYLNVTRYEEDQWLRLWFLGGEPQPTYGRVSRDDRHGSVDRYWLFIQESWQGIAPLLQNGGRLVVRLGAIGLSSEQLTDGLDNSIRAVWPSARPLEAPCQSSIVGRQARSFMPQSKGCLFEMDYVYAV